MKDLFEKPAPRRTGIQSSHKTLILWVLLILMFLAVYQLFSRTPPTPAQHVGYSDSNWFAWVLIAPFVGLLVGWVVWSRIRLSRFNRENAGGIELLNKGITAKAAEVFESLVARYRWPANLRITGRHNAAIAQIKSGQLGRAIELLAPLLKDKSAVNLHASAGNELAVAYALSGDLAAADKALAVVEKIPNVTAYHLIWPRVVIAARRGEFSELARTLESRWRELESQLSGEVLRRLTLLRAFALASVDGVRGPGSAEPLLERLRPAAPGEFTWLSASWPELDAFLQTHPLNPSCQNRPEQTLV